MDPNDAPLPMSAAATRVLVVDDDPDIAAALVMALRDEGYDAVSANDGEAAIASVKSRRPDLVLLDLMMPGYSGWDFLTMYRLTTAPYAPILVITAAHGDTLLGVDSSLGVQEVVRKPYSLDHIIRLVRAHTGKLPA